MALGAVLRAQRDGFAPEEIPALSAGRDLLEVTVGSDTSRNLCYAEGRFRNLVSEGILISFLLYLDSLRMSAAKVLGKSGDEREN